jgi:hypothetical protein
MQEQLVDIRLMSEYSPLVELAMRLGYRVYLCPGRQRGSEEYYRIDDRLGRYSESRDLVDALAFMIKRDMLAVSTPIV